MGCGRKATSGQVALGRKAGSIPRNPARTVADLYKAASRWMRRLGGGEGLTGIYGTLTRGDVEKVMQALTADTGMNRGSRFLDVGAGLGQPLLHAALKPGVARARGFEIDDPKVKKAAALIAGVRRDLGLGGAAPQVIRKDIADVQRIDDTHLFSFWEGINVEDRMALGRLAMQNKDLKGVAVMAKAIRGETPAEYMEGLGFPPVTLKQTFPVHMAGSGQGFTAYVFKVNPRS